MAPERTYDAVVHGQPVTVKVYRKQRSTFFPWTLVPGSKVQDMRRVFSVDATFHEDPATANPHPRRPVDMNDCEE